MAATLELPFYTGTSAEGLTAQDFETASIRSAAPSYVSDAPSYHSTVQNTEPIPAYTPRSTSTVNGSTSSNASSSLTPHHQRVDSFPPLLPSRDAQSTPTRGLPPVPSGPAPGHGGQASIPSLASFRIPPWSTLNSNPTARHYHNVARRRATAARSDAAALDSLKRVVLERVEEEERVQALFRPLEDPYLVGEAASRARRERLALENGDDILLREDRRWDFFLTQTNDWEKRERSWTRFHRGNELKRSRGRLGLGRRFWAR